MSKNPLHVLRIGLAKLNDSVKARKDDLSARHVDNDAVDSEVKPTRKEALTAVFNLQKYIADMNEPYARRLEGLLASFGRQTRLEEVHAMETPYITEGHGDNPITTSFGIHTL
ncbi:hypothetical protein B0H34DRAFT_702886 [Crassisporium funariophilum]|nr:hypothetical protein B0H34DRAFT_702886 [Crassisporium funariophilum]